MANYSLILDTKFKPFSYAEMLAPVAAATQAHQALEEEYANLATKANVWEEMANEQADPYAYKMYKTYSDDLEARAEQLMKYGLNASSRRGMLDMRARYSKEIIPIENAYKRREKLVDEQRAAMLSNPTLFYQRDAASMSLDDFIKNPSLDYGAVYSGALLAQQAGQIASNLKTALTKKGDLKSLGLQFQYERLLQYGYTPDQIEKAITNPKEGDPILTAIVDQVLESSGMTQWASPEQMRRARAFANQGLYNAIGQSKLDNFTDQAGLAKYKADLDDRNAQRAEARKAQGASESEVNAIRLSGISYLQGSGTYGKYQRALAGLKAGQQGVSAAIFGKHGTVNPITVYDKAQTAMSAAERRVRQSYGSRIRSAKGKADYEVGGYGAANDEVKRLQSQMNSAISSARSQAYFQTLQSYGVTKGITKDQYDALKAIGYKGGTTLKYSQLTDPLNALAQERSYYSTNMSGYDIPDQKIRAQLGNWNANGNFSTAVYKLNADGTQGKAVSYKDLKLANGEDNTDRKVTGIYYSAFTPGKIIVQIGESGDRYLMDPNVLGSEVAALVGQTKSIIASDPSVDLTEASIATTTALSRLLNSYNPTAPKSSKDTGE